MSERFLEFVHKHSGEVSSRVDVTGQSDRQVEKCMRGMLINIGDDWYVRDTLAELLDDEREPPGYWRQW